eukprot:16233-Heterococcus_DN1.PRE.2
MSRVHCFISYRVATADMLDCIQKHIQHPVCTNQQLCSRSAISSVASLAAMLSQSGLTLHATDEQCQCVSTQCAGACHVQRAQVPRTLHPTAL